MLSSSAPLRSINESGCPKVPFWRSTRRDGQLIIERFFAALHQVHCCYAILSVLNHTNGVIVGSGIFDSVTSSRPCRNGWPLLLPEGLPKPTKPTAPPPAVGFVVSGLSQLPLVRRVKRKHRPEFDLFGRCYERCSSL